MFMGNKEMILRECECRNRIRRVENGVMDHRTFFHNIRGDLLVSGYAATNTTLMADLIEVYMQRGDMPLIVFSSHGELFEKLRERKTAGRMSKMMITDAEEKNFHPFYGMGTQQLLRFIYMAAELQGYSGLMDRVLQYASAALNIVEQTYPASLPALCNLLHQDDDVIAEYALQVGLSDVIADNIRANRMAGIILRRICEKLGSVFEGVYVPDSDTKYTFQTGVQGGNSVMVFDFMSSEQKMMNMYLKEELFYALKRVPKIRVVLDEMDFDIKDELLSFLFTMKRQRKIELIFVSQNPMESAKDMQMSFANIILSQHEEPTMTEELSKALWGTYLHNYPVTVTGKPPAVLFTFKSTIHWQIATEERLKVRAMDLYPRQGFLFKVSDLFALKTSANENIFLVPSDKFMPVQSGLPERSDVTEVL